VGLFSTSLLNGTSTIWTQEGPSTIGNVSVDMITSRTHDGSIVIATHGNGVYAMQLKSTVGIENINNQNSIDASIYPNPMNDNCTIKFSLKNDVAITIAVYNIYGEKINTLVENENMMDGKHEITWNGKNQKGAEVSNGNYFVVINSNNRDKKVLKLFKY
jgi:flagellar hook assembly protein FlgD